MTASARKIVPAIETKPLPIGGKMLALEPRYVFDAALGSELQDLVLDAAAASTDHVETQQTSAALVAATQDLAAAGDLATAGSRDATEDPLLSAMIAAHNLAPSNREIAFIDSRLADISTLVSSIPEGTRIVLIDASRDGVAQMVEAMKGEQGITGIHILSHGSAGNLQLGSALINADTMASIYRSSLTSIGANLSTDADILVYGCNFAAGDRGAAATSLLATLTGADVAASEDLTGSGQGGDWQLEARTGAIEISGVEARSWDHTLVEIQIQDGSATGVRNQPVTGTLAGLATAINPSAPVTFTAGTFATSNGSVTIQSDGSYTYTPNAGYLGQDAFQFEAMAIDPNDGFAVYATAIHVIQIDPDPNYQIVTSNETDNVAHQTPGNTVDFNGTVADNVTPSPLGGPITSYTLTQGVANGTLTFNPDGTFSYHPNANYSGQDSFTVQVNDADPNSDPATVTVYLNVSGPPLDAYGYTTYAAPNTPVTVTPGQYEADPAATFTYTAGTSPDGTVVNNGDGSFTFMPNAGFNGTASFTYTVTDSNGYVSTDTVYFIVGNQSGGPGVAPLAAYPETVTVTQGSTLYNGANYYAGHSNGAAPVYSLVVDVPPTHGTLTSFNPASGAYTFVPTPGYVGTDSFTFTVTDQYGQTATNVETINILPPDLQATSRVVFAPIGASVSDTFGSRTWDPTTQTTEVFYVNGVAISTGQVIATAHGTLTITDAATGAYTWQPNAGFSGPEVISWSVRNYWGTGPSEYYELEAATDTIISPNRTYAGHRGFAIEQGTTLNGSLTSFSGSPSGTISYQMLWNGNNGTASVDSSGNYSYTANAGFVGIDRFGYEVQNGLGQSATNYITVLVTGPRVPGNLDPIATTIPDRLNIDSATVSSINVAGFFSDPDGDPMTFVADGLPAGLTMDAAGNISGTIDGHASQGGFGGQYEVTVFALDDRGGVVQQTFLWGISNPIPDAVDDGTSTGYMTPVVVDLLANDNDPDGDALTVTSATLVNPAEGALSNVGGVWTFTPAAGFSGTATITYTIQDQDGATDTAQHTVVVANAPPTLVDPDPTVGTPYVDPADPTNLVVPVVDNVPGTIDLDAYYTDPNGDPRTITPDLTGVPGGWTVSYDPATGVLSYTAPVDNTGPISIPVTVTDGNGGTFTGTITLTPSNPGPDAVNDATSTAFNTPVTVNLLGNDTDPDNDPLTVTTATVPAAQGTVAFDGTNWVFTPAAGFSGTATITYTIQDQDGATDTAQHTVTVAANAPPVLVDPDPTVGTPYVDPADPTNLVVPVVDNVPGTIDLDGYYTDPNGDPRTITPDLTGLPAGWTVSYDPATGVLSYTAPVDNTGPISIPVTVTDGNGGTFTGSITLTPTNPGPDAVNDATSTTFNTPVTVNLLGNDTDPDNDPLTVTTATVPAAQGTVAFDGTNWVFTPAAGFSGTATITYTIQDQDGATDTAQHTVTVAANSPPVLVDPDPTVGTPYVDPADPTNLIVPAVDNVPGTIDLDAYYTDPNGDPRTITPDLTGVPAGWTVSYDPATGVLSYTAPIDNSGPISIPVTVTDGNGGTFTGTITLTPSNPGPDAVNDATSTAFNTPVTVNLLGNDTDPDNDPLTVTTATVPAAQGTVAFDGTNWVFTPAAGFSGTATITYTIQDQDGATDTAQHTVTVSVPALPVAVNDYYTTPYATAMTGDVRTSDTFTTGSTFSALSQPMNGTLVFNPDGTYTYTPSAGFVGTESFVYQITDPAGQTALAIEVIRVAPPAIIAVNDAYTTPFNTAVNGNASQNDTFALGSTFQAITAPMHGTLAFNADGSYVYTPNAGYTGLDMFAYAVTDVLGQTRFATDTITVQGPPAPIAVNDAYTTGYQTSVSGNAAAGDTYLPGATFAAITTPTHGTVVFNPDGTYTYTPAAGFAGIDTFNYRVTDSNGQVATATETITVTPPALVAVDDAYSGVYGQPVNGNAATADTFVPGSTFVVASNPSNGTVTMNANGTYAYTPAVGFSGTDTFTYRVTDPTGQTVVATETIVITPPGLIAVDDSYTTAFNTPVNGNAATGDTYASGSTFAVAAAPSVGTVSMNADGSYRYTPAANYAGTVTFTYRVTDPTGRSVVATETIVISPPQLIAVNDVYTTPYNTALNGNAAAGDTYATGSVFAATSSPSHGTVSMNADGTYRYIPATGFTGTDTFSYSITDPTGRVVSATETITVAAAPAVHRCLTTFGSYGGLIRRR